MVDARVTVVDRGRLRVDLNSFVDGAVRATSEEPNPDAVRTDVPVFNLVVDHPEGTLLWDTGVHPDAGDGRWPDALYEAYEAYDAGEHRLEDDLEAAGYGLDDVDYVFQTHLHPDHAGGLERFDGTDVPVFVHEEELKYAYYSAKTDAGSRGYLLEDFDHDLNWRVLHRDRETHFEDVEFVRLPGHTPGLTGTVIDLDCAGTVAFVGDELYCAENLEEATPPSAKTLWSKTHWFESLQFVRELRRRRDAQVVFGHDPDQFPAIVDGW